MTASMKIHLIAFIPKKNIYFSVLHRGINYLRNDFRAINRGASRARKNGLSASRRVDTARCTGITGAVGAIRSERPRVN